MHVLILCVNEYIDVRNVIHVKMEWQCGYTTGKREIDSRKAEIVIVERNSQKFKEPTKYKLAKNKIIKMKYIFETLFC